MTYSCCERLLLVLADQACIRADDFAHACDLAEGESIALLSTALSGGVKVSLFFCEAPDEEPGFVLAFQGDADILLDYSGPFASFAEAQSAAGVARDQWVD